MYLEALGIPGPAASDQVENLARWVQWASTEIQKGASTTENAVRYNLSQFWAEKDAYISSGYPTAEELDQLNKIDVYAHGLLVALDTGRLFYGTPEYWQYAKMLFMGSIGAWGAIKWPDTEAVAEEARQAALDAAQGAKIAGQNSMADYYTQQAISVNQNLDVARQVNTITPSFGSIFDVIKPVMPYIAIAVVAYIALTSRRD